MERHGTSTMYGAGYLIFGDFRRVGILMPSYFSEIFAYVWQVSLTLSRNLKRNRKIESLLDVLYREVNRKHLAHLL